MTGATPNEPGKVPTLKCPDCGGVFRTLDWWQPGMPCPSCGGRNMAPVVEVVKEESPVAEPAAEQVAEKAQEIVKEAFSRKGWRRSPLIGALAGLVILAALWSVFTGGRRAPKPPDMAYVCDACGHQFMAKRAAALGQNECPKCGKMTGCHAALGVCPHCGKTFELYHEGYPEPVYEEVKKLQAKLSGAADREQLQLQSQIVAQLHRKRPGGEWLAAMKPEGDAMLMTADHVCPHCKKQVGAAVGRAAKW